MHAHIAKWAPPHQRSSFSAFIYGGATAGLVVSMPIGGLLAGSSFLGGWPSIFYVFGAVGVAWFVLYTFLVFENPDSHPWISASERALINAAIGLDVRKQHVSF
jgi:MFS family permease